MITNNNTWQRALLLPRYYEKNAHSIAGLSSQFQIKKFQLGHDPELIDETTNPPGLRTFDTALNQLANVFYEAPFKPGDIVFANGRLLFKCVMPEGAIAAPAKYSLTGLIDQEDDLIAVSLDLPDWVTPTEGVRIHPYINFPIG
ncbi:hypothetical protein [Spartinivicinus marinus]|uniref:hypothetical protein n=1 Tax=Spartinivicinus marinus TaxID=2994442 RepID=UPI001C5CBE0D|nr:hypothetical protein [Spartinivicinus marinus]MCX4030456.1 hypothetical protein [Spartinivicinus marinus]